MYTTGIRRQELIDLKILNIDYSNKRIKVLGKRNKERYIPLISSTIESIDIETEEDFLIAESILQSKKKKFTFTYHEDVDNLIKEGIIKPN